MIYNHAQFIASIAVTAVLAVRVSIIKVVVITTRCLV